MRESKQNSSIQPYKLANKEGELRHHWQVSEFKRLSEMLIDDSGRVEVIVQAYFDDRRRCLLKANIKAELKLECQTTFEAITHKLDKVVVFCAVNAESQFAEVEEEFEPVLMEDGFLDMAEVIEDEIILSVPIVANKSLEEIDKKMSYGELDEEAIAAEKAASNPFSVLQNLKKT
ncbi:YceD family protein [Aliikangiella sp. G2MR2-5]|uniref:YceD family protein n=1 Tax=Aliikangiella sp. G2MR2-5 TaxID=2788943 RepID=UPI0018A9B68A|nr:YceD family protein [Aliikangiella sp. G2MR2-5]